MSDLIPHNIYERIKELVEEAKPAKVTLNINGGKVESAEVSERIVAEK